MVLAAVSDIHGNLPALDAVLAELKQEQLDELVCLGHVAVGPEPVETVARIRETACPVVMGNWDAWAVEGFPPAPADPMRKFIEQGEWWARKLSDEDRAFIGSFVPRIELELAGIPVLCFHGSPASHDELILATTPHDELHRMLAGFDHPVMLGATRTCSLLASSTGRCS